MARQPKHTEPDITERILAILGPEKQQELALAGFVVIPRELFDSLLEQDRVHDRRRQQDAEEARREGYQQGRADLAKAVYRSLEKAIGRPQELP